MPRDMTVWPTQAEADDLLGMEKHRVNGKRWNLPDSRGDLVVPIASADGSELFLLDISRKGIDFAKGTVQNRARKAVVLARIDYGGAPHRNPDDEEIACPHIHFYRETFGDKWAYSIPLDPLTQSTDGWRMPRNFMRLSLTPLHATDESSANP